MEQEMDGICLDESAVKHFEDRKFISIGDEELLYRENSFYFYPTIAFYEGTGNTLAPTCIRMMRSCQRPYPSPESRLSRKGIFSADTIWEDTGACRIPSGACERPGRTLRLGAQAINFQYSGSVRGE